MAKRSSPTTRSVSGAGARGLSPDCRIVVLAGKEAFLRSAYTESLRKALRERGRSFDVFQFEGGSCSPAEVFDECRSAGLMAEHKLVIVDDADQFVKEDHRPIVERYAQAPSDTATLVLRSETWNKGKLDAMIEKVGVIVKCDPLTPGEATKAVFKRASEFHQRRMDPDAAEALVERAGTDLARLDQEIAKLASAVTDPAGSITAALVRQMVAPSREEKAWVIQDELVSPDPAPALAKLRELLEVSRIDPVPLRWAYTDLARKLHALSAEIAQGVPAHAAGRSLKLWGPSVPSIRALAARTRPQVLAELFRECVEADYRGKTGQGDPVRALEALTLRFASVAAGRADT